MTKYHFNVIWPNLPFDIDKIQQIKIHTVSALYVQLAERIVQIF